MADGASSSAVHDIRRDLAAAYRLIALEGMDDGIYTHVSARLPDGPGGAKRFLLNPYGLRFDEVTASNLVTIDGSGAVIDDPYGAGVNAAGFTIHSAVHMARHDAACVLHTHTVAGVAVSSVREGLLSLNQWSAQFHDVQAVVQIFAETAIGDHCRQVGIGGAENTHAGLEGARRTQPLELSCLQHT